MAKIFFLDPEIASAKWTQQKLASIPHGESLLDAGAGERRYKNFCTHLKYTSQDFAQYDGTGDHVGLQTKKWDNSGLDIISDIIDIPVKDGSFDNILCTEVLEHVPYPDRAIKEFSRILKSGGKLIITAPFASQTHFAPYHFCSGFNVYWYAKILKENNFQIIESTANGNYFNYIALELLRAPLVARKYSLGGAINFVLFIVTVPVAAIMYALSSVSRGSEKQLTFGHHILARKL